LKKIKTYRYGGFKMKVKPLADRVTVKLEKNEAKTAGGIIIPDTAQEKTQTGVVVAIGPGTEKEKITVKNGDRVMYDKYAGTQIKIDGEEHLILKMSDIIAVVE
jgi:chaperonin GroES